jgi:hypothetical protein
MPCHCETGTQPPCIFFCQAPTMACLTTFEHPNPALCFSPFGYVTPPHREIKRFVGIQSFETVAFFLDAVLTKKS